MRESGEKAVIFGEKMFTGKCVAKYCYKNCSECKKTTCLGCRTEEFNKNCDMKKMGNTESPAKIAFVEFLKEYNANK